MAKVITFSRTFPAYHPRKGEPTYFVEKFIKSWDEAHSIEDLIKAPLIDHNIFNEEVWFNCLPKHHTIRAGHRFKAGEYFSPRVWSGKPYNSKQIIIAPDTEIKKVWNFEMKTGLLTGDKTLLIEGKKIFFQENKLAENDGLNKFDLYDWFQKPFKGQIICWNENISY